VTKLGRLAEISGQEALQQAVQHTTGEGELSTGLIFKCGDVEEKPHRQEQQLLLEAEVEELRGNDSTKEMKEQMAQWTPKQQAAQLAKEAAKQQALGIASATELAGQEAQQQAVRHTNKELAAGQVDSLDVYPDATEKRQRQAQRMQNEKIKLREQLANAFAEGRRKADEKRLQFEEEKLRGNELRQILERQMLEMHQLREEQRVRYEKQRIRSEASEQQQRRKRYERQCIRPAAREQQQRKTWFDSSSDEDDVQVAQRGSTAFLDSVIVEDTRSQAPADVAEGECAAGSPAKSAGSQGRSSARGKLLGSPAKSAGSQRRSSAGGELSDPSNAGVTTLSAKGTSSQARGSRAVEKYDNSSEDDNDTHRRGVKQVIADFEMVG